MSRVSILLDNALDKIGLSGRSIVNLLTGFGCNVPALMMARSSSSKKERTISLLIIPFVACSARVLVINYVCNALFTETFGWLATLLFTVISGMIALLFGLVFSKTMFRKQRSFFLVEMVNWRKPDLIVTIKNV